jgi:hypothetical protein
VTPTNKVSRAQIKFVGKIPHYEMQKRLRVEALFVPDSEGEWVPGRSASGWLQPIKAGSPIASYRLKEVVGRIDAAGQKTAAHVTSATLINTFKCRRIAS